MGDEDPIPWEYVAVPGQDQDGVTLQSNFAEFKKVCKSCDFTEDKITDWFGVNNANRDRGKKLFRGGHVDLAGSCRCMCIDHPMAHPICNIFKCFRLLALSYKSLCRHRKIEAAPTHTAAQN